MLMVSMAIRPAASHLIGAMRKGKKKNWRVALGTARAVTMKVP
jgi:hypothetical protein